MKWLPAGAWLVGRVCTGFVLLIMIATLCGSDVLVASSHSLTFPAAPLAVAEMRDTPLPTLTPTPKSSYPALGLPTATPTLTPPATPPAMLTPAPTPGPTFTRAPMSTSVDCLGVPAYAEIRPRDLTANLTPVQPISESQYQKWNPGFSPF